MTDGLDVLMGKEACPVCGTISQKGTARCPECGTFHSGVHLEEREAPSPEERAILRELDPSDYSMNPDSAIVSEDLKVTIAQLKIGAAVLLTFHSLMKKNLQLLKRKSKFLNLKKLSRIDLLVNAF